MIKQANEIQPGDMWRGHIVEAVLPGEMVVILYFRKGTIALKNDALVLVEGSIATPPPQEDASPTVISGLFNAKLG